MSKQELTTKIVQITCPQCGKDDLIPITKSEILTAKKNHKLIPKAIQHQEEGHILAAFIDIEGFVRRRYCFEIVKNTPRKIRETPTGKLETIFNQMIQNSRKIKQVIQNLTEIEIIEK